MDDKNSKKEVIQNKNVDSIEENLTKIYEKTGIIRSQVNKTENNDRKDILNPHYYEWNREEIIEAKGKKHIDAEKIKVINENMRAEDLVEKLKFVKGDVDGNISEDIMKLHAIFAIYNEKHFGNKLEIPIISIAHKQRKVIRITEDGYWTKRKNDHIDEKNNTLVIKEENAIGISLSDEIYTYDFKKVCVTLLDAMIRMLDIQRFYEQQNKSKKYKRMVNREDTYFSKEYKKECEKVGLIAKKLTKKDKDGNEIEINRYELEAGAEFNTFYEENNLERYKFKLSRKDYKEYVQEIKEAEENRKRDKEEQKKKEEDKVHEDNKENEESKKQNGKEYNKKKKSQSSRLYVCPGCGLKIRATKEVMIKCFNTEDCIEKGGIEFKLFIKEDKKSKKKEDKT